MDSSAKDTPMTLIRPITKLDIADVQRCASDPAIAKTANLPSPYPSDGAETWFERISKGILEGRQVIFAIVNEDNFVGVMSINNINQESGTAALDYWVAKDYWGMGHATIAAKSALNYIRPELGLTKVTRGCLERNTGSKRVLEKCGFVFTSESLYAGPFKDRFGGETMMHCQIELK